MCLCFTYNCHPFLFFQQYLLNKSTSGGQEIESDRVKDASEVCHY